MTEQRKKPRRPANAGGLYQRADGMWIATIELPATEPGKRRRKVIKRKTRALALQAQREAAKDFAAAGDLPTASPTLSQWCDQWWTRHGMTNLKVTARESYRSKIEQYVKPSIGRIRLDKLTVEHVYRMHDYIMSTRKLSPTTALRAHAILSSILAEAVRENRVGRNVAQLARKPKAAHHDVIYLDNAQARDLLLATEDAGWAVAFLTGMRRGERLGLTTDAIDFEAGTITVSWQVQRIAWQHGCGDQPCGRKRGGNCPDRRLDVPADQEVRHLTGGLYLVRPKNRAGWRVVPMDGLLTYTLMSHIEATGPGMEGLIFHRPDGRPIDPGDDDRAWRAALAAANLPHVGIHSARHTCNTVLTELGVPIDVRQAILGHASRAVNEAVYTHTSDTRIAGALEQVGRALDWR